MTKRLEFKKNNTNRGFKRITFKDSYDSECSIQESSLATEDRIWLGIDDANPQVMAKDANERCYSNPNGETVGWIPFEIPQEVFLTTRMHLNRKQAKQLAEVLLKFSEDGNLEFIDGEDIDEK